MKLLLLIRKTYSRFCAREVIIVLQVAAMLLLSVPIVSQLTNLLSIIRMADDIREPSVFFESDQHYFLQGEITDGEAAEHLREVTAAAEYVGMTTRAVGYFEDFNANVCFYNDALAERTHFKKYLADIRAHGGGALPVVVSGSLAAKYPVGSEMVARHLLFPVRGEFGEFTDIRFVVVGAEHIPYYYYFYGGATNKQLESIAHEAQDGENYMIALGVFDMVPIREISPSYLLFADDTPGNIERINQLLGSSGQSESLSAMRRQSLFMILAGNPMPFVLALMMVFLCVGSVASYAYVSIISHKRRFAVYYLCGMSRARGLLITLASLGLLLLVATAAAAAVLPFVVDEVQLSKYWGVFGLLLGMYAVGNLTAALRYRGMNPIQMLHKNE